MRKLLYGLILLAVVLPTGWLIVLDRQGRLIWDHWDEAKRGVLYRSGQMPLARMQQLVRRSAELHDEFVECDLLVQHRSGEVEGCHHAENAMAYHQQSRQSLRRALPPR